MELAPDYDASGASIVSSDGKFSLESGTFIVQSKNETDVDQPTVYVFDLYGVYSYV